MRSKNVAIVGQSLRERTTGRRGRTTGRSGRGWSQGANQSQQGRWSCSQLVVPPYDRWHHQSIDHWHYKMWRCFRRRIPWLIVRSIVGGHDWSFMATTSRTLLIARPRVRPIVRWPTTSKKTDRSMRPLLKSVANIADRSHVRLIATNRTNRTIRCDCVLRGLIFGTPHNDFWRAR